MKTSEYQTDVGPCWPLTESGWSFRAKPLTLAPWSRVLEKLVVAHLVEKFSSFHETQRFSVMFTRTCSWNHFNPVHTSRYFCNICFDIMSSMLLSSNKPSLCQNLAPWTKKSSDFLDCLNSNIHISMEMNRWRGTTRSWTLVHSEDPAAP
jgi:hypothetical protein